MRYLSDNHNHTRKSIKAEMLFFLALAKCVHPEIAFLLIGLSLNKMSFFKKEVLLLK